MADEITNDEDVIDSRDVIKRISDLESLLSETCGWCDDPITPAEDDSGVWESDSTEGGPEARRFCGASPDGDRHQPADEAGDTYEDEREELSQLRELAEEASGYAADWEHGEALIRDSYFETYAETLADDIGAIDSNATWPLNHIDWEAAADELKIDYTSVSFGGVDYWVR